MTKPKKMTTKRGQAVHAPPENQVPQGPVRLRREKLSDAVPVRLPAEMMTEVRRRADEDDLSVSSWIRRAVEREIGRTVG